jgi:hypothetical protein
VVIVSASFALVSPERQDSPKVRQTINRLLDKSTTAFNPQKSQELARELYPVGLLMLTEARSTSFGVALSWALDPIPLVGMVNEIDKLERNVLKNSSDPIPLVGMVKEIAELTARVVLQSASPSRQAGWGRLILTSRVLRFPVLRIIRHIQIGELCARCGYSPSPSRQAGWGRCELGPSF